MSVVMVAFFPEGDGFNILDGGAAPMPPDVLYPMLLSAHQMLNASGGQDVDVKNIERGTDAMTQLLIRVMEGALQSTGLRFSNGDVMSAALHLMVDAGMVQAPSKEELIKDIVAGAKEAVEAWSPAPVEVEMAGGLQ